MSERYALIYLEHGKFIVPTTEVEKLLDLNNKANESEPESEEQYDLINQLESALNQCGTKVEGELLTFGSDYRLVSGDRS